MAKDSHTLNLNSAAVKARAKAAALDALLRGRNPELCLSDAERETARVIVQEVIEADIARLELELTQLNSDAANETQFLNVSQLSERARRFLGEHF